MKIAIGPLVGEYGGPAQQILNIMKHSKYSFTPIKPSAFSVYYSNNRFKQFLAHFFLRTCGMKRADFYGLFLSKVLSSRFDIVHLHGHPWWPEIYWKPKSRRAKYVHTVHNILLKEDFYEDYPVRKLVNDLLFESCRESDVVISVAKWLQKLLLQNDVKSVYIPNGVNVKEYEKANPVRFRKKYHISDDFFLFAADMRRYKRPELFVELARRMPDKMFVMIGRGMTLKGLRAYMNASPPQNVTCLGELPRHDVIDAFAACKVFVLPSKNEAFGIALLEAMACRKPVVAANNAGPKGFIAHGRDGFLFEPDNAGDLYEKSCMAWDHAEVGEKGYRKVKERFDWPIVIKQIDEIYQDLVTA